MTIFEATLPSFKTKPALVARRVLRRFGIPTWILIGFVALMVVVAIFAPLIAPDSTTQGSLIDRLLPLGTKGHLLGTDGLGRDVLSRLIVGMRLSLLTGFVPVLVGVIVGGGIGMCAGLGSRRVNSVIMRILDVFYAFPTVLLAIAIGASLGPGVRNTIIALSVVLTPPIARIMEAAVVAMRDDEHIQAARCSGASALRIAATQVLPNVAPQVLVYCTSLIGLSIIEAAGLSFLGLGASPPTAEWGLMLNDGIEYILNAPAIALSPAIAILLASLVFNLLGDRLQLELNVRKQRSER